MAAELPLGLETVTVAGSADVPAYWIPIDKDGVCTAPVTAAAAVTAAAGATNVFLLSHGWNNDSVDARSRYLGWISQLLAVQPAVVPGGDGFRPVFVGVFWPSMIAPSPAGALPQLAGAPAADASSAAIVDELGDRIGQADADWLAQALTRAKLPDADAARAAALLLPLFAGDDTELVGAAVAGDVDDVIAGWRVAQGLDSTAVSDDDGELTGRRVTPSPLPGAPAPAPATATATSADPLAAGLFEALNPAWLARLGSVLLMKDRAGRVGGRGVSDLLDGILAAQQPSGRPRVHLVGHSFGCKVVLSALVTGVVDRPVDSVLLLQPALNARAFAADAGNGRPGGYRQALQRCRSAIIATYSSHDFPLTKVFHLAARRRSDLGEVVIAAGGSKYAALGGFGPQLVDDVSSITGVVLPPRRYPTAGSGRILAVDASEVIGGHGDVVTPATAWMLASQLTG